jgi:hypothetical protein
MLISFNKCILNYSLVKIAIFRFAGYPTWISIQGVSASFLGIACPQYLRKNISASCATSATLLGFNFAVLVYVFLFPLNALFS